MGRFLGRGYCDGWGLVWVVLCDYYVFGFVFVLL